MLEKAMFAVYSAYWNAKLKLMKLANEEDGMQTIEAVILIAIAVIVAAFIVNALTGDDNGKGLIDRIFDAIVEKLKDMGLDIS